MKKKKKKRKRKTILKQKRKVFANLLTPRGLEMPSTVNCVLLGLEVP